MKNIDVIFGAPGCGKTHTLISILKETLKTIPPNKIAYVSFTRKGAYEGRDRAKEVFGFKDADFPYFRTLHSIAFRLGGYKKNDMISKRDYKTFSDAMGMKFTGYYTEDFKNNDDQYLFMHFLKVNNPMMADRFAFNVDLRTFKNVSINYERFKEYAHVIDFSDMLVNFIQNRKALPVDIAIIDEAQDLTSLQWRMCEIAFAKCKKIYIAGDDDQAIYEWNGADVDYFLNLKGHRIILNKSYRLRKNILSFAKLISREIKHRVDKQFLPLNHDYNGEVLFYNDLSEIDVKDNESWYFLARNNWFLNDYREFLRSKGLIFIDKHDVSIESKIVNAINIFEKLRKTRYYESEQDEVLLKQYLKKNIDLKLPWYNNFNLDNNVIMYLRDIIKNGTDLMNRNIVVNTIHGVKGGEADNVVIRLDFTRNVNLNYDMNTDSELRCLYVACTRAFKKLHVVHSSTKYGYDNHLHLFNRRFA